MNYNSRLSIFTVSKQLTCHLQSHWSHYCKFSIATMIYKIQILHEFKKFARIKIEGKLICTLSFK